MRRRPLTWGIVIQPSKQIEVRQFKASEELGEAVGGLFDCVALRHGQHRPRGPGDGDDYFTMYVNDEYLYLFGPEDFNSIATDLAGLGGRPDLLLQGIKGPVVLEGPPDREGESTSLPPAAVVMLLRVAREAGYVLQAPPGHPYAEQLGAG